MLRLLKLVDRIIVEPSPALQRILNIDTSVIPEPCHPRHRFVSKSLTSPQVN